MNRPALVIASLLAFAATTLVGHLLRTTARDTTPAPAPTPPPAAQPSLPDDHTFQQLTTTLAATTASKSLASQFNAIGDDFRRRRLVVLRWAEVDPHAALDFLVARPGDSHGSWYYRALFETWARNDPETAFANCHSFPDSHAQHGAARAALDGAATVDPDRAFALFFATKKKLSPYSGHRPSGWIHENPQIALTQIQKHGPDTRWSRDVRDGILATWVKSDPAASLAWVKNYVATLNAHQLNRFLTPLAGSNTAAAAEFFSTLPQEKRDPHAAGAIATELLKSDPTTALIWIDDNMKGLPKQDAIRSMLQTLAATDPATAAPYVTEIAASDRHSSGIIEKMMKSWTRSSPGDARAWIETLPAGKARDAATRHFAAGWHQHDPATVIKFIHDNPPEIITKNFLHGILGDRYGRGERLDKQVATANAIPDHYAAHIAPAIAVRNAYIDPASAAEAVVAFKSPEIQKIALDAMLPSAISNERKSFATWIAAQPDPTQTRFLEALKNPVLEPTQVQQTLDLYQAAKAKK